MVRGRRNQMKRGGSPDRWVSLNEAARLIGIARLSVAEAALRGELVYEIVAGRTVICRDAIARQRPTLRAMYGLPVDDVAPDAAPKAA